MDFNHWIELYEYAEKEERKKIAMPIWLGNLFLSGMGITEERTIEEIMAYLDGDGRQDMPEPEDIKKEEKRIFDELLPIAEKEMKKNGTEGKEHITASSGNNA